LKLIISILAIERLPIKTTLTEITSGLVIWRRNNCRYQTVEDNMLQRQSHVARERKSSEIVGNATLLRLKTML